VPLDLICVPWDTARRGERMGAGPPHFTRNGAMERLREVAGPVRETVVGVQPDFPAEIATAFDVARATAFAVRAARGHGGFPLVLAGNCITAVGVLASLPPGTGVVWLDAHGDVNTPETTRTGFLDGMSLATVMGRCWRGMAAVVHDFAPVPEDHVLHVGGRDLDPAEIEYLERSRIGLLPPDEARDADALAAAVEALAAKVERVYLHVDLDVHDPSEGVANPFPAPGGLTGDEVRNVVRAVAARLPIAAAAITAYDPTCDADGRMLEVGLSLMELIAEVAATESGS
jgi:arginase